MIETGELKSNPSNKSFFGLWITLVSFLQIEHLHLKSAIFCPCGG
jgi:hypothetical protein